MVSKTGNQGFALLLTLVVISVVLAIGLSLLNITVKQFTLSATTRDSELAFHAANTGAECMQEAALSIDVVGVGAPNPLAVECAGVARSITRDTPSPRVFQYSAVGATNGISWSADSRTANNTVCTEVDFFILDASSFNTTFDFRANGYGIDAQTCDDGRVCSYIFARGYNRPCDQLTGLRVVQRELTLSF